ncbi:MAG TPA: hypothetical protein RMH85_28960 [Polyangiaceae bacterium LLY-WYZ-15_(1-7)]|nr:hypothetical protein [Myxococcales bacterium]MAT24385.1 hypothetical protein [Sandaracinus sp.]HJL04917.1 hypothetical protein [Polyangiaceae bacterium LLY-WYZ-15_(1-7)]MBJ70304.1 hypothetical protein [Sandaracinus sp.]HJL12546.1 hypothetical protein [Polyangiaceae bacterium LLY-WYZ-15_(1-7)]
MAEGRKPPPPPPPSTGAAPKKPVRSAAPPPPLPKATKDRAKLASEAMALRDEQLKARVVYVDPSLQTNAELDAITAKVVEELQELQRAGMKAKMPADPGQIEIELIKNLRELLEKMVSARREHFLRHKVELIQRKIANLYFTSEVYTKPEDAHAAKYDHADEALLAALQRHLDAIVEDLLTFQYREPGAREQAIDRIQRFEKKLAADVLARSRPELERLLGLYRDVLLVFLLKDFRESLGEFAWEVVQQSQIARGGELSYKILEKQFPRFRSVFEEKFMDRLLAALQEPLARRMQDEPDFDFRPATLRFAADPRIYAEICGTMCNTIYGYLHGEGFLDLPVSWQMQVYDN